MGYKNRYKFVLRIFKVGFACGCCCIYISSSERQYFSAMLFIYLCIIFIVSLSHLVSPQVVVSPKPSYQRTRVPTIVPSYQPSRPPSRAPTPYPTYTVTAGPTLPTSFPSIHP